MRSLRRVVLYGLGFWVGLVAVSLVLLPLEGGDDALHESLKSTALVGVALGFTIRYLRRAPAASDGLSNRVVNGLLVGLAWAVISVVLDLGLYLLGAFTIGLGDYFLDVGSSYMAIPVITALALGFLEPRRSGAGAAEPVHPVQRA